MRYTTRGWGIPMHPQVSLLCLVTGGQVSGPMGGTESEPGTQVDRASHPSQHLTKALRVIGGQRGAPLILRPAQDLVVLLILLLEPLDDRLEVVEQRLSVEFVYSNFIPQQLRPGPRGARFQHPSGRHRGVRPEVPTGPRVPSSLDPPLGGKKSRSSRVELDGWQELVSCPMPARRPLQRATMEIFSGDGLVSALKLSLGTPAARRPLDRALSLAHLSTHPGLALDPSHRSLSPALVDW